MNGSLTSSVVSGVAWTVNVLVPPLGTVSVAGVIAKSPGLVGPLGAALNLTVASASVPSVRLTVYVAVAPSLTVAGPVIENFCASSAPARPGSAIKHTNSTPAAPRLRTFARNIFKAPPSTSPWCTTITVRKKGWLKNLPGRRGVAHAVRVRCRYRNSEATSVSSARRSKGTKDPGPTGVFRMREFPCSDERTAVRTWGPLVT